MVHTEPADLIGTSARLLVRRVRPPDLLGLYAVICEPGFRAFMPPTERPPGGLERLAAGIELIQQHVDRHGFGSHLVVARETGAILGLVGLQHLDDTAEIEIFYRLVTAAWGHGFATEAAKIVLADARRRGVTRVVAVIEPSNARSLRVAAKLGFTRVGTARHYDLDLEKFATELDPT